MPFSSHRPGIRFRLAALLAGFLPGAATAQTTITWLNAGSAFDTGFNWIGGSAPANNVTSHIAVFNSASPVSPVLAASRSIAGLRFGTSAGAYTLSGTGTLTLGAAGIDDQSTAVTKTVAVPLALGAASTFTAAGALTISGNIANNGHRLTLSGASSLGSSVISGVISGTGGLENNFGGGTWTLTGNNTYTGGTLVLSDTLQIGNGGTSGSIVGDIVVNNVAALVFNRSDASTFAGNILDTGTVTKRGAGTLTLTGSATHTGGTFVETGTLQIGNGGTTGALAGSVTVSGGATLAFNRSDALTFSGALSGAGALLKTGAGTLTLAGANTFTGGTTLNAGTLALGASNRLADNGAVTLNGGTFALGAFNETVGAVTLNAGAITGTGTLTGTSFAAGDGTISASLAGNAALVKSGPGTLTLTGANTFTGGTTVSGGLLIIGSGTSGSLAGNVALSGDATLEFNRSDDLTFAGALSGAGELLKIGVGTLTLTGAATHTGITTVFAGTLRIGNGGTTGSLTSDVALSTNVATLAFNRSNDLTFAGAIFGFGGLLKAGAGTLTLTGASTFTGGTTINAGTLALGASNRLADNGAVILNGGTFALGAFNETVGAVTLNAGSITGPGTLTGTSFAATAGAVSASLAGNAALTKSGAGTLTLTGANTFTGGATLDAGTLALGSAGALGGSGTLIFGGGTLQFSAANTTDYSSRFSTSGNPTYRIDTNGQSVTLATGLAPQPGGQQTAPPNGSLVKSGAGTLTLTGDNSLLVGVSVAAGTLQIGGGGTTGSLAGADMNVTVSGGATLAFNRSDADLLWGTLSGAGALLKLGAGTLTLLTDANTFTGGVTLNAGTLALRSAGALGGSGPLTFGGGTLQFSNDNTTDYSSRFSTAASQAYRLDTNGQGITLATALTSAGGSLVKSGAGTLTLSGNNTYAAGTTISAGTLQIGSAGTTGSLAGNVSAAGGTTLAFNRSDASTFSGALSGAGALLKTGAGTLTLNGTNTFTGGTTLDAGTLALGSAGAIGGSGVLAFAGGTLQFSAANTTDYSSRFSTAAGQAYRLDANGQSVTLATALTSAGGSLVKSGAGTLTLSGNNTYAGGTTISAGTLQVGGGGTTGSLAGNVSAADGATLAFNRSDALTFSGVLSGAGALLKSGPGTLTLSGTSTYTGGTTISAGTLALGGSERLANTGAVTINGGTFSFGAFNETVGALTLTSGSIAGSGALTASSFAVSSGAIDASLVGSGALTKTGTGTVTLNGASSYTGGTMISNGTLALGASDRLANNGTITLTGGTFTLGAFNETVGAVTLNAGAITGTGTLTGTSFAANAGTISASLAGNAALVKSGPGTLTLSGAGTFTGGTALNAGTLAVGHDAALGSGLLTLGGGSLQAGDGPRTLANAVTLAADTTLAGTSALTLSGAFTLAGFKSLNVTNTATTTISGIIGESGTSIFIKQGTGLLELTGANTHTGGTLIAAGTVRINNLAGSAFGPGAVTLASGATLTGAGAFTGAFQNNGIFSPGNSPGLQTLTSFTQGPTGILQMELGGLLRGGEYDALDITGAFTPGGTLEILLYNGFVPLGGATFNLFDWASIHGTFATVNFPALGSGLSWDATALYTSGVLSVGAIPEPSTYAALIGLGVLALALRRRGRLAAIVQR